MNIPVQDIKKAESNPNGIFYNGGGGANSSYISYISYNISRRFELELFLQNLYIRGRGQTPLTSLTSLTISPAVLNNKTLPNSYRTYI